MGRTTWSEDREITKTVLDVMKVALELVEWDDIAKVFGRGDPEDIFSDETLRQWAEDNGLREATSPEDTFSIGELERWAENNGYQKTEGKSPDDVFSTRELDDWAEDNDYVKWTLNNLREWAEDNGYVRSDV